MSDSRVAEPNNCKDGRVLQWQLGIRRDLVVAAAMRDGNEDAVVVGVFVVRKGIRMDLVDHEWAGMKSRRRLRDAHSMALISWTPNHVRKGPKLHHASQRTYNQLEDAIVTGTRKNTHRSFRSRVSRQS